MGLEVVVKNLIASKSNDIKLVRIPVLSENSFNVMFVEPECIDVLCRTIFADKGAVGDVGMGWLVWKAVETVGVKLVFRH